MRLTPQSSSNGRDITLWSPSLCFKARRDKNISTTNSTPRFLLRLAQFYRMSSQPSISPRPCVSSLELSTKQCHKCCRVEKIIISGPARYRGLDCITQFVLGSICSQPYVKRIAACSPLTEDTLGNNMHSKSLHSAIRGKIIRAQDGWTVWLYSKKARYLRRKRKFTSVRPYSLFSFALCTEYIKVTELYL